MTIRLNFIVEGQTEETFVNLVLREHLANRHIWARARCVATGRKRGVTYRGGLRNYVKVKNDIRAWMMQDQNQDARFTTMFDVYGLPNDFPSFSRAIQAGDPYERVKVLEEALANDIGDPRLVPYLQLHEFEALLLSDPRKFDVQFHERETAIQKLVTLASRFNSPELIDDGISTAPSKRIANILPEYPRMKVTAGPIVANSIGLPELRSKCRHFADWLDRLEDLG